MNAVNLIIENTLRWIKVHSVPVLVGVGIAILIASPHLRAWIIVGPQEFKGVHVQFSDDEITYQARIKEVVEGNFAIGNPYIKEHMNDSFIMPPIAEWTIAFFVWITDTSVPFVTSVSDGVLGFVDFILVYMLFLIITGNSMGVSLLYTVIFFLFSFSTFGRPISPQFNALFLFLGLIVTSKIYFSNEVTNRKLNLVAGLIAGITCFISPYYFTALLVFYVLIFIARAIYERSIGVLRQNAPWFFAAFLPLAFLYAFFQFQAAQDPSYSETVLRYGLMHTHIPGSFTNMLFGGIALGILVLCFRFISFQKFIFAFGSLVTIFALNWQNIITGKSLQFSSHYLFTTILLVLLVVALLHVALLSCKESKFTKFKKLLISSGILFLLIIIGQNQMGEYSNIAKMPYSRQELIHEQAKMEVFDWFNANTEADSVVYSLGGQYDFLLPIYTKNKVFYNFYAALYPAFDAETEERWIIQHLFDQQVSSSTLRDAQRDFWGNRYIDSYQSQENRKKIHSFLTHTAYVPASMIPDERIQYIYNRWLEISARPIEENFRRYEINYILVSSEYSYYAEAVRQLDNMKDVSLVAEINNTRIYTFR